MYLYERIKYYLEIIQYYLKNNIEIIKYYLKNNIVCRFICWFGANSLILFILHKISLRNIKYVTMDPIRFHKNM